MKILGCKLPEETYRKFSAIAVNRGLTKSELLREIIHRFIEGEHDDH
jgi:predicted DNA-binding protein